MDKIEKIKAEIELRIAQWSQYTFACASQIASEAIDRIDELKGLLTFIDSMQEDSNCGEFAIIKNEPTAEDIDKVAQELYEHLYELKKRNNRPTNLYDKQEIIALWKAGIEYAYNHPKHEQPMPDSTKLIELWHEDKEMLKEKDFRDDPWRLAYNAFMCGFGRGLAVKQAQPEADLEKEITEHAENMPHGEFTHDSECREHEEWAMKEFRYFYELGLNARK